ncbi:MAG: hypothetical protein PHH88_01625 [Candidatus Pacebacteria bacterium]|nr:hypothetical protein [Candidatus Paceibacterota bacterium]MDD4333842.1 hypothetical protein [Candidatus Paceibacterota bacterium]
MIFKETLIKRLQLENASKKEQLAILEKTADLVMDKTLIRLMKEMSEEEAKQMNDLLNDQKEKEVAIFLYKKFPNINDIFDEEIENIKEELVKQNGK